jgi:hypothetical protein
MRKNLLYVNVKQVYLEVLMIQLLELHVKVDAYGLYQLRP